MKKMLKRLQRVCRVQQVDPRQIGSPGGGSAKKRQRRKFRSWMVTVAEE